MRFHPTRGALCVAGGVDPPELCEDEARALADMRRLIGQFHDPARSTPCQTPDQLCRCCAHG